MTSSPIKKIERTSYINLSDANWNQATNVWHNLPVHTPKVISKGVSTRSSPGTEQQRRRRSSSGAAWYSSQQQTPPLLSNDSCTIRTLKISVMSTLSQRASWMLISRKSAKIRHNLYHRHRQHPRHQIGGVSCHLSRPGNSITFTNASNRCKI